jgi:hypothetical protein
VDLLDGINLPSTTAEGLRLELAPYQYLWLK